MANNIRLDIESRILGLQTDIAEQSINISTLQTILSKGIPSTDAAGRSTVGYQGTSYLVTDVNGQILVETDKLTVLQQTLADLNNRLPLASINATSTASSKVKSDTVVKSYNHATRIFVDDNLRLSPKYGFLFYVEFEFNTEITNISGISRELGMIVKSATLPKFTVDTKIHNAYNRKNISQHKISYDPVSIAFHDDQDEVVRNFWYDYYSFFYRDSDYSNATYQALSKYQQRPSFDWGYSPRPQGSYTNANNNQPYQYIQAIRIYSLFQRNFSEYELVNPIISKFNHGEHSNSDTTALLKHDMTIQYEAVKYHTGYITKDTVGGFIDLHYDTVNSPNGIPDELPPVSIDLASLYQNPASREVSNPIAFYGLGLGLSSALGGATRLAATAGINSAGFSIPNLSALTAGITNSAILGQQLQAAGAALAGTAAASLANGVLGGLANGLGPQGTAVIGLVAQVIANPSAALNTIKNMAINYATGVISNFVSTTIVQPITGFLFKQASEVGQLLNQNIITPIVGAFNEIATKISTSIADAFATPVAQAFSVVP